MNSFFRFLLYFFAPISVLLASEFLAFAVLDLAISKIDMDIVIVLAFVLCILPAYLVWHVTAYLYRFNAYGYKGKNILSFSGIMLSVPLCYFAKDFLASDFTLVAGSFVSLLYCHMFWTVIFKYFPLEKVSEQSIVENEIPKEEVVFKATPEQKLKAYKKIVTYLKEQDKKNKSAVLMVLLFSISANSQVKSSSLENVWIAKEYSKEAALWNSKDFLFNNVLKIGESPLKFEVIPLAAASSGDLTTLIYKSEADGKEGLILGFYGNFWNDAGVLYLGYRFKNLEKEKAIEFLDKIQNAIDQHSKYMKSDSNNNNIVFKYDDLKVLIFDSPMGITTRIFWEGFDSTWEKTAFDRSKRRFENKIK